MMEKKKDLETSEANSLKQYKERRESEKTVSSLHYRGHLEVTNFNYSIFVKWTELNWPDLFNNVILVYQG